MIRLEAKKSVSIHEDEGVVRRRLSNTSSASNLTLEGARRQRSASAMSKRRLSAVSESGVIDQVCYQIICTGIYVEKQWKIE